MGGHPRFVTAAEVEQLASEGVEGPDAATDGHLAVFDGPTGKIIKDGGAPVAPIPPASEGIGGSIANSQVAFGNGSEITGSAELIFTPGNLYANGTIHTGTARLSSVIHLTPISYPGATPVEGMIYACTDHHLYYYNGSNWKQLDMGVDSGWMANADDGDKMEGIAGHEQISEVTWALDNLVPGAGNLLKCVAGKLKALEAALRISKLPQT